MTERLTVAQYAELLAQSARDNRSKKRDAAAERKRKLALIVLIRRLEREHSLIDQGVWKKGMEIMPNGIVQEYPAIPGRKFRFDLAIPGLKLLIEFNGGARTPRYDKNGKFCGYGGGHHSAEGREADDLKARFANILGFCLLTFTWGQVASGAAADWINAFFLVDSPGFAQRLQALKVWEQT